MSIMDWIIGFTVLIVIFVVVGLMLWDVFSQLSVEAYRMFRYDRRGICYQCKLPYRYGTVRTADQMYGPDEIVQGVCPNGHRSIPRGNRRFAEW